MQLLVLLYLQAPGQSLPVTSGKCECACLVKLAAVMPLPAMTWLIRVLRE
jgi:hypothetical protein